MSGSPRRSGGSATAWGSPCLRRRGRERIIRTTGAPQHRKLRRGLHPERDLPAGRPGIEVANRGPERAVLVGLTTADNANGTLEELARLTETAGASVAGVVV